VVVTYVPGSSQRRNLKPKAGDGVTASEKKKVPRPPLWVIVPSGMSKFLWVKVPSMVPLLTTHKKSENDFSHATKNRFKLHLYFPIFHNDYKEILMSATSGIEKIP